MNRRGCRSFRVRVAAVGFLAAAWLAVAGCADPQTRLLAEDESERVRYEVKTIGDVTTVANSDPIPVAGVGLVVGLNGTGSSPPKCAERSIM